MKNGKKVRVRLGTGDAVPRVRFVGPPCVLVPAGVVV
jgi:hypothetical protein